MASARDYHSPSPESVFGEESEEHNNILMLIEKATDNFIFQEFRPCIEVCSQAIRRTITSPDCSRCRSSTRTLAVLAIQAYAELNQWDLVLPFVQNVYGDVESCPARVMQLCLLLHARVKQFVQCHAMAKVWLQYNANNGIDGYSDVAKLYVRQILVPLGAYNLVAQFVDGCSELTSTEKQALLSPVKKSTDEVFRFEKKQSPQSWRETTGDERQRGESQGKHSSAKRRFKFIRSLWCTLHKTLARWRDWNVWRILVMLALGTMAIFHTQFDISYCGFSRAIKVWEAVILMWNRVCDT